MAARKRKLHLNLEGEVWKVKKAFGFFPEVDQFTAEELRFFLAGNEDVDVVLKY